MFTDQSQHTPEQNPSKNTPRTIELSYEGELFAWAETGTEGFVWAMQEDGKQGYDGLVILERGDAIQIFDSAGAIVFDGIIQPDREANWTPRYDGAEHGQPLVKGCWVHWTQTGWSPEAWLDLFMNEDHRAHIVRTREVSQEE